MPFDKDAFKETPNLDAKQGALDAKAFAKFASETGIAETGRVPAGTAPLFSENESERLCRLLRAHGVKESHIRAAVARSKLTGESLTTIMRSNDYGFLSPEKIAQVNAQISGFPYFARRDAALIDANALLEIVLNMRFEGFVPVAFKAPDTLVVALAETRDSNKAKSVFSKFNTQWCIASPRTIQTIYQQYFARTEEAFDRAYQRVKEIGEDADDAPRRLAELQMALIRHACYVGASDIGIQSMVKKTGGVVRLKVNGVGEIFRYLEPVIYRRLVTYFVTTNANGDALRKGPVESKIKFAEDALREYAEIHERYEFRAQMIKRAETLSEEYTSIVIRILDQNAEATDIEELGFDAADRDVLMRALKSVSGLILVTGPTGSGKTTTIYAALSTIDPVEKWIQSIERPIEYTKGLWNQFQISNSASEGAGAADLLKGLLRKAPDVIFVGEVRDAPMAREVIRSANTGHVALSTLHNNDAASALLRLKDLGVDMGDAASVLRVILAQRLVRTLCVSCRVVDDRQETQRMLEGGASYLGNYLRGKATTPFRAGDGCPACKFTGYRSRAMVYELLHVTPRARRLITEGVAPYLIAKEFIPSDRTLRSRAIRLMASGITSFEEVDRLDEREE